MKQLWRSLGGVILLGIIGAFLSGCRQESSSLRMPAETSDTCGLSLKVKASLDNGAVKIRYTIFNEGRQPVFVSTVNTLTFDAMKEYKPGMFIGGSMCGLYRVGSDSSLWIMLISVNQWNSMLTEAMIDGCPEPAIEGEYPNPKRPFESKYYDGTRITLHVHVSVVPVVGGSIVPKQVELVASDVLHLGK